MRYQELAGGSPPMVYVCGGRFSGWGIAQGVIRGDVEGREAESFGLDCAAA